MKKQKGQALILIAFGIIAMLGFVALAIDGGNAFADRRHAQNAADTAALSAALAKIQKQTNWQNAAFERAASNTYDNNGVTNTVTVHSPPIEGQYTCAARPAECNDYLQVIIVSHVDTWFARILGVEQMTNRVLAVAKAKDSSISQLYNGAAFVSLMPGCKPAGYPNDPFNLTGGGENTVTGSGLWVNSTCNPALTINNNAKITINGHGIDVMGGCNMDLSKAEISPPPDCNLQTVRNQYPYPPTNLPPNPTCSSNGSYTSSGSTHTFTAGRYTGTFPPVNGGTLILNKGIYCLDKFRLTGTYYVTTDVNNNGKQDANEGVLFFVKEEVTINSSATLFVRAMQDGDYKNLFMYMPLANPAPNKDMTINITGNANSLFTGTILNPSGHCTIAGSGDFSGYRSQVICYSVSTAGNSALKIVYEDEENYDNVEPPQIEITE